MDYVLLLLGTVFLYAVAAYGLNLVLGHAGILPVCVSSFAALGAYCAAFWSVAFKSEVLIEIVVACLLAALLSLLVSLPSLRLHDDYFVLATFALQIVSTRVLLNWSSLTNGALGHRGIPDAGFAGYTVASHTMRTLLCGGAALVTYFLVRRVAASPFGRVLRAIRSDELFARSLGKDTTRFKVAAFVVTAVAAAASGVLYAHYFNYIDPSAFDVMQSVSLVSIVIIGGAGSRYGPFVGAALFLILPDVLRFLPLPNGVGFYLREMLFSSALLWVLLLRPRGLAGDYQFGR